MALVIKELPQLQWQCCSFGISIFKNTCQMQLFRDPLPPNHLLLHTVLSHLSFSWLPLTNQQLVSQNKTLPRNKQDQSLPLNLFQVLTAKNLMVVGLCNQSKLEKKKNVVKNVPRLYQLRGWICCPSLELVT